MASRTLRHKEGPPSLRTSGVILLAHVQASTQKIGMHQGCLMTADNLFDRCCDQPACWMAHSLSHLLFAVAAAAAVAAACAAAAAVDTAAAAADAGAATAAANAAV